MLIACLGIALSASDAPAYGPKELGRILQDYCRLVGEALETDVAKVL